MNFDILCVIDCWDRNTFYYDGYNQDHERKIVAKFQHDFYEQLKTKFFQHQINHVVFLTYKCFIPDLRVDQDLLKSLGNSSPVINYHQEGSDHITPEEILQATDGSSNSEILISGMDWFGCTHGRSGGIHAWLDETQNNIYTDLEMIKTGINFVSDQDLKQDTVEWQHIVGNVYQAVRK